MASLPAATTISSVLHPPSDEDTLRLYTPAANTSAAAVDELLLTHPIAVQLRAEARAEGGRRWIESRPHMKLPPAVRAHNLTAGPLIGEGKIVVPPLVFQTKPGEPAAVSGMIEAGSTAPATTNGSAASPAAVTPLQQLPEMVTLQYLGGDLCGHPGIIHGGLSATLLDEGLARCCFPALPNKVAVTASLKIDYRAPVMAEQVVVLRATTTKLEGRKVWVTGRLEDVKGTVLVEAEALFIEPKQAAIMAKIAPSHT